MLQRNGKDFATCLEESGGENIGHTSHVKELGCQRSLSGLSHNQTQLKLALLLSLDRGGGVSTVHPLKTVRLVTFVVILKQ